MTHEVHAGHPVRVTRVGEGPPCLLLHCALARSQSLFPLARAMRGPRTAIFFDLPGFGASPDVGEALDHQGECAAIGLSLCTKPTHVIGHSYGATVALRMATMRPALVRRLTLIEPVFFAAARGTPEHAEHMRSFAPFIAAMDEGDRPEAARIFNDLWGAQPWARIPARVRDRLAAQIHMIPRSAPAIEDDVAGLLKPGALDGVTMPVHLIRGARSRPVIAAVHARLLQLLPQARESVVAGAGHMVPLTHVEQVAALI